MNWEIAASIAEIVAAVGVIVSLAYLGRQLRMTREVDQVGAFQSIVDGFTDHSARFFSAPNQLASRGLNDRSSLDEAERLLFDQLLANVMSQGEMAEGACEAGLIPPEGMDSLDWFLRDKIFVYPGARDWLVEFSPWYTPHYLNRLERASRVSEQASERQSEVQANTVTR